MKRLEAVFTILRQVFAVSLVLSISPLSAQTNFVKYTGNPVLPLGNPGEWDDAGAAYAHVSFDGTTYHLWYSGSSQMFTYRIGYASSPDGVNWNKNANNPILSPGSGFDNVDTWTPVVLFDGAAYQMWYTGNSNSLVIGYATAADPASWTKHTGNPVIAPGGGAWEQNGVHSPIVIRTDTLYHMWYSGISANNRFQSGYATSSDGLSWSKHSGNPVLPVGAPGEWDAVAAIASSVIFEDGQFQMWYHGTTGDPYSNWKIGYATSPDGVSWTKHSGNPILQPGSGWDAEVAGFPRVIKDGHRYRMWYTGRRLNGAERLGYAEDFSNAAHVDSIQLSRKTAPAVVGSRPLYFSVYIANPRSENLTARALIKNDDGSTITSVDLEPNSNNRWQGEWAIPAEPGDYSIGVELNNITGGYLHNSFDWGVFEEIHLYPLSHTLMQTAQIADGGDEARGSGVAVAPDGTVFFANGDDGLRAYRYDGTSFTSTAHIDDGGGGSVAVTADSTVFLAYVNDGLRAYRYNGTSFTNTAHIKDGGDYTAGRSIAVATDGTVFLANGRDGLRAYRYDGNSFTNVAHIDDSGERGEARNVAVISDGGTVFLANGVDGLWVYRYDGNSFTNTAHDSAAVIDVAIASDGTVFAVSGSDALRAYHYDGTALVRIAHTDDVGFPPEALALGPDGTIFLSISWGDWFTKDNGLWAYTFDGESFTKMAYAPATYSYDVAVASDGTVFNATRWSGLIAYTYSGATTDVADAPSQTPQEFELQQNYPNPFNPSTTIELSLPQSSFVSLKIYNLLGAEVATLLEAHKPAGRHTVTFDASALPSGLYYYTLTVGEFKQSRKMLLMR